MSLNFILIYSNDININLSLIILKLVLQSLMFLDNILTYYMY